MDRFILGLGLMLVYSLAAAETYTATKPDGRIIHVGSRSDPELLDVVGGIVTSASMPEAAYTPAAPAEFPSGIWINTTSSYLIVRMPDGHDYAIVPTDDGRVIAPQVSFSPLEIDKVPAFVEAEKAKDRTRRKRLLALKSSPDWSGITNNLAQYETHDTQWQAMRSVATNAASATTDSTRAALLAVLNLAEKERQARDDVKTIANRTKSLLLDLVRDSQ